jgi:hypothetical protein
MVQYQTLLERESKKIITERATGVKEEGEGFEERVGEKKGVNEAAERVLGV